MSADSDSARARYGWQSDFPTFADEEPRVVRISLQDFLADASESQIRAWDDSIPRIQIEVGEVVEIDELADQYTAILEYELPLESRMRLGGRVEHVDVAEVADCVVIAPATADLMARMVHGQAPDALTCAALACRAPLVVCPAMDVEMWRNEATRANVEGYKQSPLGTHIFEGVDLK